jgi:hypothetical protein
MTRILVKGSIFALKEGSAQLFVSLVAGLQPNMKANRLNGIIVFRFIFIVFGFRCDYLFFLYLT